MTPDEASRVLSVAATLDPRLRPPTAADAETRSVAWAAVLHPDMPTAWAAQAVVDHYAQSAEWLMPAMLNTQWKAARTAEIERNRSHQLLREIEAGRQAAGAPPPDAAAMIDAALGRQRIALSVRCPWCKAAAGRPCITPEGTERERVLSGWHPARLESAYGQEVA